MITANAYKFISDMELFALFKEGNEMAFAEIYERYFNLLYLHAYHRLKDKEDAKDVVQEVFSIIYAAKETVDPKRNLSNYLYASVRNGILNIIAHKKVEDKYRSQLPVSIHNTEALTDHWVRERQLAELIEKEIQGLSPRMKAVFVLSRREHLSYKAIGEQLNLTEQSVRSHVKNALKILRTKFGVLFCFFFL